MPDILQLVANVTALDTVQRCRSLWVGLVVLDYFNI